MDGSVTPNTRLDVLLGDVRTYLAAEQPELEAEASRGFVRIAGKLLVCDERGPYDFYEVVIGVGSDFPASEPVVFEVGGRVPRTAERHVFEDGGNCCLGVWEAWLAETPRRSFADFMRGPVADYFIGQSLVEVGDDWPYGERDHGRPGVLQAYAAALGLEPKLMLVRAYLGELSKAEIKGHHRCPCGSGLRVRSCHIDRIRELRARVEPALARNMLARLPGGGTC